MVLYHGSNMAVEQPDLNHSKTNLDFGAGFYTTSDLDQADHWNLFERNHHGEDVYTASEAAQIKESVYVQNRAGNRHAGVQGHNPELAVTEVEIWKGLCRTW